MFWYIAMRGTVENQVSSPSTASPFLGSFFLSVAVLVVLISSALLLCSSFSSLIFTVLILSTLFLIVKVRNIKPSTTMVDLAKEEVVSTTYRDVSEEITHQNEGEDEDVSEEKESLEDEARESPLQNNQNFGTGSQRLSTSESESIDGSSTSEDSEVDWRFPSDMRQGLGCSDDSISDDDSLIEIDLPEVNYIGSKEESTEKSLRNFQDFSPDSIFPQQDLVELLAEINDMNEENLIEIDISMGSIKCSRVDIEA